MLLANDDLIREIQDRIRFAEEMSGRVETGAEWSRVARELRELLGKIRRG